MSAILGRRVSQEALHLIDFSPKANVHGPWLCRNICSWDRDHNRCSDSVVMRVDGHWYNAVIR